MSDLLLNSFFTIKDIHSDEDGPERLTAHLELIPSHAIYQGHFPENPVVPGVCIVEMIKETLAQHFKKELVLVTAQEIKFLNLINPNEHPKLELEIKIKYPGDELMHAQVVVKIDEHVFTKFRGSFR